MNSDPLRAVTVGLCLCPSLPVLAADLPRADEATDYLAPRAMADQRPRWTPDRRDESATWGGFLLWPTATLGVLADSNPFQRHASAKAATGFRFAPHIVAERDDGVHATAVYAAGDIRLYPGHDSADMVEGRAGLLHDWALRRDMIVRVQGEVARRQDPFETVDVIPGSNRHDTLQNTIGTATISGQKTFERLFLTLSGTVLRSHYDALGTGTQNLSDETVLSTKARAGYWLNASLYTFTEPTVNWRTLDAGKHSSGTRIVAGLGTERIGPTNGEIFAGYQEQTYAAPLPRISGAVAGGRLAWTPTRAWTAVAQVDQSLGQVAVGTVADPLGTPVRQTSAVAKLVYRPSALWSADTTIGAVWLDYVGTLRRDTLVLGAARLDYALSRSFDLTCEIKSAWLDSTVALASYQRTTATLGTTYHY